MSNLGNLKMSTVVEATLDIFVVGLALAKLNTFWWVFKIQQGRMLKEQEAIEVAVLDTLLNKSCLIQQG